MYSSRSPGAEAQKHPAAGQVHREVRVHVRDFHLDVPGAPLVRDTWWHHVTPCSGGLKEFKGVNEV